MNRTDRIERYKMLDNQFCEVVQSFEDNERHSDEALQKIDQALEYFRRFTREEQKELYDLLMDACVEFEQDGFYLGVRKAVDSMTEQACR